MTPEEEARKNIDTMLDKAGWTLQDYKNVNFGASLGIAVKQSGNQNIVMLTEASAIIVLVALVSIFVLSKLKKR